MSQLDDRNEYFDAALKQAAALMWLFHCAAASGLLDVNAPLTEQWYLSEIPQLLRVLTNGPDEQKGTDQARARIIEILNMHHRFGYERTRDMTASQVFETVVRDVEGEVTHGEVI